MKQGDRVTLKNDDGKDGKGNEEKGGILNIQLSDGRWNVL
jgi:hypothetical protein